jgi:hypothetical protein
LTDEKFDMLKATPPLSPDALLAADYILHRFEVSNVIVHQSFR